MRHMSERQRHCQSGFPYPCTSITLIVSQIQWCPTRCPTRRVPNNMLKQKLTSSEGVEISYIPTSANAASGSLALVVYGYGSSRAPPSTVVHVPSPFLLPSYSPPLLFPPYTSANLPPVQFAGLWKYLKDRQNVFKHFDRDRSAPHRDLHRLSTLPVPIALRTLNANVFPPKSAVVHRPVPYPAHLRTALRTCAQLPCAPALNPCAPALRNFPDRSSASFADLPTTPPTRTLRPLSRTCPEHMRPTHPAVAQPPPRCASRPQHRPPRLLRRRPASHQPPPPNRTPTTTCRRSLPHSHPVARQPPARLVVWHHAGTPVYVCLSASSPLHPPSPRGVVRLLPAVHPQGPLHPLLPNPRPYRQALLKTLRQPAVSLDQTPSLTALPPRIVHIRPPLSYSRPQYTLNHPHSLLLLHSPLYAQNSAPCALFALARHSPPFLCSWLGHTPYPPSDALGHVP
ncbi:hypothetical protein C8J57DRAFT_1578955 [Mycena rebaudengoi]|nr:hypothetical protein C8J57DRAFT_1578955 [Mycena rebaudengoi]